MGNLTCYICLSPKIEFYKRVNGFTIKRCRACGLLWVTDKINTAAIESFYNDGYFKSSTTAGYQNYLRDKKNHIKNSRRIINLIDRLNCPKDKLRVLDIGCAYGFFLEQIRKSKGWDAYGIEINETACNYARNELGLNVSKGFGPDLFKKNFFDIIFFIGTIEHLPDPKSLLKTVSEVLKENGLLVITTLNAKGLIPLYTLKPPEHLFYFNHKNITILLEKLGFEKIYSSILVTDFLLYDIFHRLGEFSSLSIFEYTSKRIMKLNPELSIKIPTNEMIMVLRKKISA